MKTPNGNQTNLNERQWLQVRTKAFKKWFGDWGKLANLTLSFQVFKDKFKNTDYEQTDDFRRVQEASRE